MKPSDCFQAASLGLSLVEILLNFPFDIEAVDENGWTPLFHAIHCGHLEVVQFLLEKGPDTLILQVDRFKRNAFHQVSQACMTCCIEYFPRKVVAFGAVKESRAISLLHYLINFCKQKDANLATLLLNAGDQCGSSPLLDCAFYGLLDLFKELLEAGAKFEHQDQNGYGVLHKAVLNGRLNILKYVFETKNVEVDCRSTEDVTPLILAASFHQLDCVKFLLERGKFFQLINRTSMEKHLTSRMMKMYRILYIRCVDFPQLKYTSLIPPQRC